MNSSRVESIHLNLLLLIKFVLIFNFLVHSYFDIRVECCILPALMKIFLICICHVRGYPHTGGGGLTIGIDVTFEYVISKVPQPGLFV